MSRNNRHPIRIISYSFLLLTLLTGMGQAALAQSAEGGMLAGRQGYPQEKLFVHTDKDVYLAGEIAWFKIYCLNSADLRPMKGSTMAYVEIIDHQQKAVAQAKVELTQDGGNGSFYLPLTLNSGGYVLRAYTNWMKNFGGASFFEKTISIINTIKHFPSSGTGSKPRTGIRFFPEGGNMIEGLEGVIGFHLADSLHGVADSRGFVMNAKGDTLLGFSPNKFGIGSFVLTPEPGNSYKASIQLADGRRITQALPAASEQGYAMTVTEVPGEKFRIRMKGKFGAQAPGANLALVAHSRNVERSVQKGFLGAEGELNWLVDKRDLADGVNIFTVFDDAGQAVSERLVFLRPNAAQKLEATIAKETYDSRELVELQLSSPGTGAVSPYNCSISVYLADSAWSSDQPGIDYYLLLTSELSGEVVSPGYYFSNDPGVDKATNDLMLTHGWRRFRQQQETNAPLIKFLPEANGHLVTARVTQVNTGRPAAGIECYLSVPSYPFGFYTSQSDSLGIVRFDVRNYYGPGEVIAQVAVPNRADYRIDILSPFSDLPASMQLHGEMPSFNAERLLERSIAMQAQNIYLADSSRRYSIPEAIDTMPFFGKAEFSYDLEEYKRFTTMEEVMREYVMPINVRMQDGKLQMAIFDEVTRQFYTDNILLLLDGIPIYDFNKIFSYDPLKIRRLDVVPRRYLYGARVFSGIASFESINKRFEGYSLDPALLAVNYEGLQLQREFYSPVHTPGAGDQARIPDMRTTLFWQPVWKTGHSKGASFFSSDMKGRYLVVVNGISEDGRPVHATTEFTVR